MSRVQESTESGAAAEGAGRKAEQHVLNGSIGPVYNPAATNVPRLIHDVEEAMDVDEEDQASDQGGIDSDGRSVYPPMSRRYRSSRPFDALTISSTRSLYDSDLEYHVENNRRYVPNYFMPNDEDEQLRIQIIHQVYLGMFNSELTSVSLHNPTKILDIGTGTGEWAIGMGEAFPNADVTGTDLSAIQPSAVPSNVFFEIFDAEDDVDWTYPHDYFDLVHFRNMTGSFRSWDQMYERAFTHLKPGGWIEVVDFDDQTYSFASYFKEDSEVHTWFRALAEATSRSGKDINPAHLQPEKMVGAGFVDVKVTGYELPMGSWPTDPEVRNTAKLWLVACLAGFEAISLRPFTQDLGWDPEEVRRVCRVVETELKSIALDKEKAKGLSVYVKILVGRKPFPSDPRERTDLEDSLSAENVLEVDEEQPQGKRVKIEQVVIGKELERASQDADADPRRKFAGHDVDMGQHADANARLQGLNDPGHDVEMEQ